MIRTYNIKESGQEKIVKTFKVEGESEEEIYDKAKELFIEFADNLYLDIE
jgi:hypothetical protein